MPIIQKQQVSENGVVFNRLTHANEYFACGYNTDNIIVLFTAEESPLPGGTIIRSLLDGFGATTYLELITEIERLGLAWPG